MGQMAGKRKLSEGEFETPRRAGNDNGVPASGHLFADTLMALRFYSRLPTGSRPHETPDLSRMAMALPFASLVIGGLPALVLLAGAVAGLPPLFTALVAMAGMTLVTGAMSEDALGDAADGLFGGSTPERRLEILKDSRLGSYGVLAIVFLVGLKAAALAAMTGSHPLAAAAAWLAAGVLARSAALYPALALEPARKTGAATTAGRVSRNAFAIGLVFAFIMTLVLAGPAVGLFGIGAAALLVAVIVTGWTRLCDRLVGGVTGDLIGALQALLEIAILGAFMSMMT